MSAIGVGEVPAGARRPWVVLQHVDHEGPGLIGAALAQAGLDAMVVRPDRGQPLPGATSMAGLVVMGGPMGVHDTGTHPWLVPERDLIAEMVGAGRPVLGVCLGAQQLAAALGAEVTTGPGLEVGLGRVQLTPAGRTDPVFGPEYSGLSDPAIPCVHWHRDTFSLPVGAVHLAATARYPHQAFRWGAGAYGLQFHVEVDRILARAWRPHLPDGVTLGGPPLTAVETVGRRVLRRLVAHVSEGEWLEPPARTGPRR